MPAGEVRSSGGRAWRGEGAVVDAESLLDDLRAQDEPGAPGGVQGGLPTSDLWAGPAGFPRPGDAQPPPASGHLFR